MNNLPKNFVMQLGSLITLYVSVTAFITLIFATINIIIPDATDSVWAADQSQSALRLSLSLLVVFFPSYIFLTRHVNVSRRTASGAYSTVTKWLIYLSLLVGGLVMMGDLVVVINTYLDGELTTRFGLKALSLLFVIGAVFYYYLLDAKEYWKTNEKQSILYAAAMGVLVVLVVAVSLSHLETPSDARAKKLDSQQLSDLQDMHWRVQSYFELNKTLPESIDTLYLNENTPQAPEGRDDYQYEVTDETTYSLCADFATDYTDEYIRPVSEFELKNNIWDHGVGMWCFERSIIEKTMTQ